MGQILDRLIDLLQKPFHSSVLIFAVILFIILLAPILLRSLKIPGIIGLILSGLIIGPHGLDWIEKNSAVDLFSTIGLLYIMFLAGLELDLKEFKSNKHKSLVFGFFTFLIPMAIGFPVCRYLLGLDFNASLLVASMFSTHTLVTYPIVSRMGISRHEAVAITVGGTMLTDTAVLVLFAVIVGSVKGEINLHFWLNFALSVVLFLLIVFLLIPLLTSWFFKKLEGEKRSHFVFVLAMVFFAAFLSEVAGLEPIIGAFAAGIALNRFVPRTSSLMNRLEFVGNAIFIPFFLISVGMLINLKVISHGMEAWIVAGTLTLVAILGKFLAAQMTGIIFRFPATWRQLIFGMSSSHAAATLAVIMVGFRMGIIDENVLNGTIVLILVTCLVASFVTENAGKRILIREEKVGDQQPHSPFTEQKILVPISNPATMERLIDFAIAIRLPRNKFPIVSLSVVDDDHMAKSKLVEAKKMLEKAMIHAAAIDQKVEIVTTIDQKVTAGIKRVAKEISATEIVIGFALKNQFSEMLFGNNVKYIVENTDQAVWVASINANLAQYKRIVVLCPKFSDKEYGFRHWLSRVFRLGSSMGLDCFFLSNPHTFESVKAFHKQQRSSVSLGYNEFTAWDDFLQVGNLLTPSDLVIIPLPRSGNVSYKMIQESIPRLMARNFEQFSFVLVYAPTADDTSDMMFAHDFDNTIIDQGVNLIRRRKKILSTLFRRRNR
ncbi:MAG: cation:proton antiporter [Marinilabiliales bacterium]|nr:cation:proton antiporter [Marinilabiliales bacterium]